MAVKSIAAHTLVCVLKAREVLMKATTAPRPQAAAPRRPWTSKSTSLAMAFMVLSGYTATVLMRVMDSSKTHGGCCDGLDCSLPCLKDLPIDVRAAQTALDYVNEHSEFAEAIDEKDLVDLSEACVFEAGKGRELGITRKIRKQFRPDRPSCR